MSFSISIVHLGRVIIRKCYGEIWGILRVRAWTTTSAAADRSGDQLLKKIGGLRDQAWVWLLWNRAWRLEIV
jgi:hypothetical protein